MQKPISTYSMQKKNPFQNHQFGSKTKILKNNQKRIFKPLYFMHKNRLKKHIFEQWENFDYCQEWPKCKGYSLCKNYNHFGSKNKIAKNESTSTLHLLYAKKPLQKTPNIRKIRAFWILAKNTSMQKPLNIR